MKSGLENATRLKESIASRRNMISRDATANLVMNCIPAGMLEGEIQDFGEFLAERRRLMALKIKTWFEML